MASLQANQTLNYSNFIFREISWIFKPIVLKLVSLQLTDQPSMLSISLNEHKSDLKPLHNHTNQSSSTLLLFHPQQILLIIYYIA